VTVEDSHVEASVVMLNDQCVLQLPQLKLGRCTNPLIAPHKDHWLRTGRSKASDERAAPHQLQPSEDMIRVSTQWTRGNMGGKRGPGIVLTHDLGTDDC
jgi:hypothetical protein